MYNFSGEWVHCFEHLRVLQNAEKRYSTHISASQAFWEIIYMGTCTDPTREGKDELKV